MPAGRLDARARLRGNRQVSAIPAVEARGLGRTYRSEGLPVRALRGVDLVVDRGEFVAVTGPSGSGKSTLLNLIGGLDSPTDGEVVVAGHSLASLDENGLARMRREHVGMIFQFFNLLEGMTALENVALPAIVAGVSRRRAVARARGLLDLLGLGQRTDVLPPLLSGGQRQRLAIARALANEPTVLLADEPTGALDSAGAAEILELLRRLHREGQAIVLVTHDPTVAGAAGRILKLRDGRLTGAGARDEPDAQPFAGERPAATQLLARSLIRKSPRGTG